MRVAPLLCLCLLACRAAAEPDQPVPPLAKRAAPWVTVTLDPPVTGLKAPVAVTNAADGSGRLFVVEQGGLVRVVQDGKLQATPFLDVKKLLGNAGGEQGLLGIAFHPNFKDNGRFFIGYTDSDRDDAYAEVKATADRSRADPSTLRVLFSIRDFAGNHNGGHLAFGPDGKLWIGTGDGGGGGDPQRTAQDEGSLLGKMLVLDVDKLPPSGRVTPAIAWKGLRNPWRYAFDASTGDMWLADVGQNRFEYLYVVDAARLNDKLNFGWSVLEGSHCFRPDQGCSAKGMERVVFEYPHGDDGCSITGGVMVRGTYLVGDYCSGRVWTLKREGKGFAVARALDTHVNISSFGVDERGEPWLVDHGGNLRRIVLTAPPRR